MMMTIMALLTFIMYGVPETARSLSFWYDNFEFVTCTYIPLYAMHFEAVTPKRQGHCQSVLACLPFNLLRETVHMIFALTMLA